MGLAAWEQGSIAGLGERGRGQAPGITQACRTLGQATVTHHRHPPPTARSLPESSASPSIPRRLCPGSPPPRGGSPPCGSLQGEIQTAGEGKAPLPGEPGQWESKMSRGGRRDGASALGSPSDAHGSIFPGMFWAPHFPSAGLPPLGSSNSGPRFEVWPRGRDSRKGGAGVTLSSWPFFPLLLPPHPRCPPMADTPPCSLQRPACQREHSPSSQPPPPRKVTHSLCSEQK